MTADAAEPETAPPASRRRLWWGVGVAAAIVGLGVASLTLGSTEPAGGGGRQLEGAAPPIELERLDEPGTIRLADFEGRPVVVNLFASWCVPCRNELPAFRDVAESLDGRVAFLGVNTKDNRAAGLAMLEEFDVPYPAGYDPDAEVATDYGLVNMPSTVFVGADGQLLEQHTGEMSRAQLEEAIARNFDITAS